MGCLSGDTSISQWASEEVDGRGAPRPPLARELGSEFEITRENVMTPRTLLPSDNPVAHPSPPQSFGRLYMLLLVDALISGSIRTCQ